MSLGKGEDTKAFREVFFGPGCEFRLVLLPLFDEGPQPLFGVLTGVGVEDGFDLAGNEALEFVFGDSSSVRFAEDEIGNAARGLR